ncbi:MAG: hypothetical protein AB7O37_00680 [Vicinamibacteria bacterium]
MASIGVLLIALPSLLAPSPHAIGDIAWDLCVKVGEAAIIAALLAATVDLYIKKRLTSDVVRDLSPFLMSANIPTELRDEVHYLCSLRIFRRDLSVTYDISEHPDDPDSVILKARTHYKVENISDAPLPFRHLVLVEKTPTPDGTQIASIENVGASNVFDESGKKIDFNERSAAGVSLGAPSPSGFEQIFERSIWVPPLSSGGPSQIWSETRQVFSRENSDAFFSSHPTIGKKVVVNKPAWMNVRVDIPHRSVQAMKRPPHDPTEFENRAAFLPMSAHSIQWRDTRAKRNAAQR